MSVELARWQFTVEDYSRMIEAGIFGEDDRVELINGEIIEMSPIGSAHAACVKLLNAILSQRFAGRYIVSVQDPVVLNDASEPEPDVALLKHRADFYRGSHPQARHIVLVIEVADTSVDYDRDVKIPLYAASGIKEAWLVDLTSAQVLVHDRPGGGTYRRIRKFDGRSVIESRVIGLPGIGVDEIIS